MFYSLVAEYHRGNRIEMQSARARSMALDRCHKKQGSRNLSEFPLVAVLHLFHVFSASEMTVHIRPNGNSPDFA